MSVERRQKPRINDPLPVVVRGSNGGGKAYQFDTVTRNIGAGGLCAVAPRIMETGESITLYVRFALAGTRPPLAPSFAARARVLRTEKRTDDTCTFAACFLLRHVL